MNRLEIEKSDGLNGTVRISGSKNSVLPILVGSILTDEECEIQEVPCLKDVEVMKELLEYIGAQISWDKKDTSIKLKTSSINCKDMTYDLVKKMRASILMLGPLLAREGYAKIFLPGGCAIGTRPIDLHLKGFAALGAEIQQEYGYIEARANGLVGGKIYLDFPSVGATENLMMAAVLAEGETIIENTAVEPEIVDLANFLSKMGAEIHGAGTDTIRVMGVKHLKGVKYKIIPDRIEVGTFMIAAAMTNGDIVIENVISKHLKPLIAKLEESNVNVQIFDNKIRVTAHDIIQSTDIKTLPFPGFPTDMQAPYMSLMSISDGTSVLIETIFENRFMQVSELVKMGADIKVEGRSAVVKGVKNLTGTNVCATDLRAGMALLLAGLRAEGKTTIEDIYHIDRGYENVVEKFSKLGAMIRKIE